ncbi:Hypothetical predicted protein, partial [Mytilus galloprovincialis]
YCRQGSRRTVYQRKLKVVKENADNFTVVVTGDIDNESIHYNENVDMDLKQELADKKPDHENVHENQVPDDVYEDVTDQETLLPEPVLVLPLMPETRPEVESHLRWLCNAMDGCASRGNRKSGDIKESGSRQQERESRRKLEAENRELRRQIVENKWRNELFKDITKQ